MKVFLMATTASSSQLRGLLRKVPDDAETASSSALLGVKQLGSVTLPAEVLRKGVGSKENFDNNASTLGAAFGGAESSTPETSSSGAGKHGGGTVGAIDADTW